MFVLACKGKPADLRAWLRTLPPALSVRQYLIMLEHQR